MLRNKIVLVFAMLLLAGQGLSTVQDASYITKDQEAKADEQTEIAQVSSDNVVQPGTIISEQDRKEQSSQETQVNEEQPSKGVIIRAPEGSSVDEVSAAFKEEGYEISEGSDNNDFTIADLDSQKASQIIERKQLKAEVEPNYVYKIMRNANDHYYAQQKTYLKQVKVPYAWDYTTGRNSTVVAVVDTGVRGTHEDLQGRMLNGYNAITGKATSGSTDTDDNGHGTQMSGIIAANSNNSVGVTGIDWAAKILPVKSFDSNGEGTSANVARGIRWAANSGADIINMSFGGTTNSAMRASIEYAAGHGKILIAASGNSGRASVSYPASDKYVIAVGSVNRYGQRSSFSNYGSQISVSTPGESLITTGDTSNNSYATVSGTSGACAVASGIASLGEGWHLRIQRTNMTDYLIRATGSNHNNSTGYGVANAYNLMTRVGSYKATTVARSTSDVTLMRGGSRKSFRYTVRNSGATIWDSRILRLGTSSPKDRTPELVRRGSGWRSPIRVRLGSNQVAPGETTTFTFSYAAGYDQQPGLYNERFCLVADDISWLGTCTAWNVNVSPYAIGYHYEITGQSANPTIERGHSASFALNLRNTGTITWSRAGKVRLGTSHPQDRYIRNPFERITHFINPARIELANNNIRPGEIAVFKFKIKASTATRPGTYQFYFTPVVDGVQWMADKGIYWDITVR